MNTAWEPSDELVELIDSLCRGDIEPDQFTRLSDMVTSDSSARSYYVRYLHMHAGLPRILQSSEASNEEHATKVERLENRQIGVGHPFSLDVSTPLPGFAGLEADDIVGADIKSQFPPLSPFPPLPTTHRPLSTSFVDGPVFPYMVASVVLCLMLLSAWAYKITHHDYQLVNDPKSSPTSVDPRCELVAQITGMKDCRWTEQSQGNYVVPGLSLGREINLAAGLLEITYKTGAKVILEGPCSYKVDSLAGGFLRQGKLVARVEKKVASDQWLVARKKGRVESGGWRGNREVSGDNKPEDAGRGLQSESLATSHQPLATISQSPAPSPQPPATSPSTLHSPLFTISTPTAVVTDLGTEFGVEVDENGNTTSHVFKGSVRVEAADVGGESVVLRVDESIRVSRVRKTHHGQTAIEFRFTRPTTPPKFVYRIDMVRSASNTMPDVVGHVFEDTFDGGGLDPAKWTSTITGTGAVSVAKGAVTLHSMLPPEFHRAYMQSVGTLDFSETPDDWWAEIRFKFEGDLQSSGFDMVRDWIIFTGVSQRQGKWEMQAFDLRAMQRGPIDGPTYDLGWWGWDNVAERIPTALARNLNKGQFYNVKVHRKPDDTVNVFLDGRLIATKPLIASSNPALLFIGDVIFRSVAGTQVIDYVKVGTMSGENRMKEGQSMKQ